MVSTWSGWLLDVDSLSHSNSHTLSSNRRRWWSRQRSCLGQLVEKCPLTCPLPDPWKSRPSRGRCQRTPTEPQLFGRNYSFCHQSLSHQLHSRTNASDSGLDPFLWPIYIDFPEKVGSIPIRPPQFVLQKSSTQWTCMPHCRAHENLKKNVFLKALS